MQIHELTQASTVNANDVFAIDTGSVTYKVPASVLIAALKTIGSLPTGVKGNAESTYRTGDVNLTPANIGALSTNGGVLSGGLTAPFVELMGGGTGGSLVDFHFAGSTADYTVRLMEYTQGVLSIKAATDSAYYPIVTTKDVREKALYNTNTSGITTYPTEPGMYRVTQSVTGLPTGLSNYYGVLFIYGAGSYYNHVYIDVNQNMYYAYNGSTGAPATWRKVTTTNVTPIS